jgi:hypothetical protein
LSKMFFSIQFLPLFIATCKESVNDSVPYSP